MSRKSSKAEPTRRLPRWLRVVLIVAISALLPTLLLSVPERVENWWQARTVEKERREHAERARARRGPLTDLAPRQEPLKVDPDEAPHERLRRARLANELETWPGAEDWEAAAEQAAEEAAELDVQARREAAAAEARRRNQVAVENMPTIPQPGTKPLVTPELWPEPPDPFIPPPMEVDPRRKPHDHE